GRMRRAVAHRARAAYDLARASVLVGNHAGGRLDPCVAAALVAQPVDDRHRRAAQHVAVLRTQLRDVVGVEEVVPPATDELLWLPADQLARGRRDVLVGPVRRMRGDHVAEVLGELIAVTGAWGRQGS